jgi:hypothetical protein
MEITNIISLVISALALTLSFVVAVSNWKGKKREEQRILEEKRRCDFDARPKLEIVSYATNYDCNKKDIPENCDIDVFVAPIKEYKNEGRHSFYYMDGVDKQNEWVSAAFKLINIGKTEITYITIAINNPRNNSLFNVNNDEYKFSIENKMLNLTFIFDKAIKPNDSFTLKINFHKDHILGEAISAGITLWLFDVYGQFWSQPLFVNKGIIYDSKLETLNNYRDYTSWDLALKCFQNPMLW